MLNRRFVLIIFLMMGLPCAAFAVQKKELNFLQGPIYLFPNECGGLDQYMHESCHIQQQGKEFLRDKSFKSDKDFGEYDPDAGNAQNNEDAPVEDNPVVEE
ncbi:MAG: hypothetical protein KBB83_01700 [Alphaproteobacteria bacterium]|nr:hypothetical protein [Alphaproteobacteria bacterium]